MFSTSQINTLKTKCRGNKLNKNNFLKYKKQKQRTANKRYNKCGFACSLKHLKSLHTFVLADS